ncbi:MAG: DNA polymerase III subunit gamma/tau [Oscillospiraceae bacterium]|jgi:DNA polymerase-3 subunit gamma/tau|nr:DNA polymerase III subunit gamma/tau [Oscillospiraceae bacterium]
MYQVLYRKYRSPTFADVVGQDHVTTTLRRALATGRLSHAYLFTGPRGTGKTSCARILAKAVNCLEPRDGEPCNACELCRGIDSGSILDVIEIDAASNNGVDNIRDLRDETNFTPAQGKYRVYIIDEVHMLSAGAFNALLKTLEEPPSYVIFILATTEVHKLPATVLSRCQRFDFHRISAEDISKRLLYVAGQEGIALEPAAAMLLARVADGAMRDSLSLLDRCRAEGEAVTAAYVAKCIGMADRRYLFELTGAVLEKDVPRCLELIHTLYQDACDMERLCEELLFHLRNLLILLTVRSPREFLTCTEEDLELYKAQAACCATPQLLRYMEALERAAANLRRSADRRMEMELALIRLCVMNNEQLTTNNPPAAKPAPAQAPSPREERNKPPSSEADGPQGRGEPEKDAEDRLFAEWPDVISHLRQGNPPLSGILDGSCAYLRGDFLLVKSDNPALGAFIRQNVHAASLKDAVHHIADRKVRLGLYKAGEKPGAAPKDPLELLAERAKGL